MFLCDDLFPDFSGIAIRHPIELRHQLRGPDVRRRIAMAIQAPGHVQRLLLPHFDHLIDAAVAAYAANASGQVRLMAKINVVG